MKTISVLAAMALSTFFLSCNNDDDVTPVDSISGTWKMQNVSGKLQGINIDYRDGDVNWIFNTNSQTLKVDKRIVTVGLEDTYAGLDSGTYSYEIQELGETQILYVNNQVMGGIIFSSDTLTLDRGSDVDGFVTIFVR